MLGGEYRYSIDAKGRVSMPAKLRCELGSVVVVTRGVGEKCLFVYTQSAWSEMLEKVNRLPLSNKDARYFVRFFVGGASECEMDKQGRINIPQYLRDYGGITKEVVIAGASSRLEVWDEAQWDAYNDPANCNLDEILERVSELGII